MRKTLLIGLCGLVLALTVAAPAFAGTSSPTNGTYGSQGSQQLGQVQGQTSSTTPTSTLASTESASSSLPFTGLNIGIMAVVAVALLGTGLVLRIRTRSDQ